MKTGIRIPPPAQRGDRGFTILEILIAIVILVLGVSGILALFPAAIESGNLTVQDSYAAAITQSVVNAVSKDLRESRYQFTDNASPPRTWTYFVFDHDGVYDTRIPSPQVYTNSWDQDWCILLPQGPDAPGAPNTRPKDEPIFMYPSCPDRAFEGIDPSGTPQKLPGPPDQRTVGNLSVPGNVSQLDDWSPGFFKPAYDDTQKLWVRRVFMLGRYRAGTNPPGFPNRAIRSEFLGAPVGADDGSGSNRIAVDPWPHYSFALAIKRAKIDAAGASPGSPPDGLIGENDPYSSALFELRVLVFRGFDGSKATHMSIASGGRIPRQNIPVREFITLISL